MKTTDEHILIEGLKRAINEDMFLSRHVKMRAFRYGSAIHVGRMSNGVFRGVKTSIRLNDGMMNFIHENKTRHRFDIADPDFSLNQVVEYIKGIL